MTDVKETVGVKDEFGEQVIAQQRESLTTQQKMYSENMDRIKAGYENYKTQWDIEDRIWQIRLEYGTEKLVPVFKYESNEEYRKLIDEMQKFKYREEKHMAESALNGYLAQLKDLKSQYDGVTEKLAQLEADA